MSDEKYVEDTPFARAAKAWADATAAVLLTSEGTVKAGMSLEVAKTEMSRPIEAAAERVVDALVAERADAISAAGGLRFLAHTLEALAVVIEGRVSGEGDGED